jgi:cytochrome c-type biogenesis protein CcmH
VIRVALVAVAALAFAASAAAQPCATLEDLQDEVICPTCNTTLEMSNSPVARRMEAFIQERARACDTKEEVKAKLVAEFGEEVLAAPPKRGFNLLAWVLPPVGLALAAGALLLLARRWLRARPEGPSGDPAANGRAPLDPELERRVDEELARYEA